MTWDPTKATRRADGGSVRDLHRLSAPLSTGEIWVGVNANNQRICWFEGGKYRKHGTSSLDLVNIEPERIRRTVFTNLYDDNRRAWHMHATAELAKSGAASGCIASGIPIEIDCAVGEGFVETVETVEKWIVVHDDVGDISYVTGNEEMAENTARMKRSAGCKSGVGRVEIEIT